MPGADQLFRGLEQAGLGSWRTELEPLLRDRLAETAHGDIRKWHAAIAELPAIHGTRINLDAAAVSAESSAVGKPQRQQIRDALLRLRPWRKGPFRICGVELDSEWRSNLKWERLAGAITPLEDRRVLDVGCGNGYYAYRMTGVGARLVIGIDPTLLYVMQFQALNHFLGVRSILVLPLRLGELPASGAGFDTSFSMGVLYHQRNPSDHLAQLRTTLRPGGELVLETLIYPGDGIFVYEAPDRYARMRNVWHLPTAAAVEVWLKEAGFHGVRLIDVTATTVDEQRTTEWMPFESLKESLDPEDPTRSIEGLPAPLRALFVCEAPLK